MNVANGEFILEAVDLSFPGRGVSFAHVRTYRSRIEFNAELGFGWDHSYRRRLVSLPTDVPRAQLYAAGDGTTIRFEENADGTFKSPPGVRMSLRRESNGTWLLADRGADVLIRFDSAGLITSMVDSGGVGLTFIYEGSRLARVVDAEGRQIEYHYSSDGRLVRVFEADSGLSASYRYVNGDLDSATDASGKTESYKYTGDVIAGPANSSRSPFCRVRVAHSVPRPARTPSMPTRARRGVPGSGRAANGRVAISVQTCVRTPAVAPACGGYRSTAVPGTARGSARVTSRQLASAQPTRRAPRHAIARPSGRLAAVIARTSAMSRTGQEDATP